MVEVFYGLTKAMMGEKYPVPQLILEGETKRVCEIMVGMVIKPGSNECLAIFTRFPSKDDSSFIDPLN